MSTVSVRVINDHSDFARAECPNTMVRHDVSRQQLVAVDAIA
jgi:hypothetical protein